MNEIPDILLLDDGELDDLFALLDEMPVQVERRRGVHPSGVPVRAARLLVTTPRHAEAAASGGTPEAPNAIVAVDEDSNALRRRLRRWGYDLLVRRPTHPEVWRLLVERALYRGDERRGETRMPVASRVNVDTRDSRVSMLMVDISNRGCRLVCSEAFQPGQLISIEIPAQATGDMPLRLGGQILRTGAEPAGDGAPAHSAAVVFDLNVSNAARQRLSRVLNTWTRGPDSLAPSHPGVAELPACDHPAVPGLKLDDETDPAIRANVPVDVEMRPQERREHARRSFSGPVRAESPNTSLVLMGRDLSAGGMRVERLPELGVGDSFTMAIYGPGRVEALRVGAEVVRDAGEEGLALSFRSVDDETARELEKMVACLPDLESLHDGEAEGLGTVLSQIVAD